MISSVTTPDHVGIFPSVYYTLSGGPECLSTWQSHQGRGPHLGPVFRVMHHSCYVKGRHRLLPLMNWRRWQPLCSAPLLHGLTAPWGLQGNVATYSLWSVIDQGLGVGVWAGEWLTLHIDPASVHTSLSLHPEARDSLLVFFLPVSIITTHLWKLMSHLNGKDDEVKRHGNTALIHILNIIKTHMEMHLRKHAVSIIVFPMRQLRA